MKNLKCAVGATLLTPAIVIAAIALLLFYIWLIDTFALANLIIGIMIIITASDSFIVVCVFIWFFLYDHCVDYFKRKKT